ncbi:MAG: CHAP domain-containing protein [Aeromicrobium sp.]
MSRSRVAFIVLFFASFMVAPTPAQAAYTIVCTGYTSCTDKGYSHAGYASAKGTSYWAMYTGTNCTNYVAYRLVTTNGMPNKRPKSGVGNARDWGTAMSSVTDSTPAVGAVAWWGKTGNHVAYIERVVSSTEIWVSESNWSGAFDWRRITKSGSGWPDGFIHFADAPAVPSAPVALTPTAPPSISGTLRYGGTLTAAPGTWSPAPSAFLYQWIVGGADVAGATATTFKPRPQDVGRSVSLRVRAAKGGYTAVYATSEPTAVIAPAPMSVSVRPTVTGTLKVGQQLTATTGTWSRTGLTFAYQWLADGIPVDGATSPTYSPRSVDLGVPLTVAVTAQREGFVTTTATSAATERIAAGTLTSRTRPSVAGNTRVGSRLTASPGTWSPTADLSYQWYADGRTIAGATERTYSPSYGQRGTRIRVKVTARRAGFTTASATSAVTPAVTAGSIKAGRPSVTGKAVIGTTLTVTPGTIAPATAKARYQWLRDGATISGARGRTHKVSTADLGHRLSVRVSFKAAGYSTRVVTTPQLTRVKSAAKVSVAVDKPAAGAITFTIRVAASRVSAPRGTISVTPVNGSPRTVKVSSGRATIALTGQPAGTHAFRLTYKGTSTVASTTVDKTATVR